MQTAKPKGLAVFYFLGEPSSTRTVSMRFKRPETEFLSRALSDQPFLRRTVLP
jgi:hypothetical protein